MNAVILSQCSAQEVRLVLEATWGQSDVVVLLHQIKGNQERTKMFEDDVIAKLTAQKTIADSVKALLETLSALIKANPGPDPVKQAQIIALLDGNTTEISDAVVANTPAATPAEPAPTV